MLVENCLKLFLEGCWRSKGQEVTEECRHIQGCYYWCGYVDETTSKRGYSQRTVVAPGCGDAPCGKSMEVKRGRRLKGKYMHILSGLYCCVHVDGTVCKFVCWERK